MTKAFTIGSLVANCLLVPACDPGGVSLVSPRGIDDAPALAVHARLDTSGTSVAAALGWTEGVPELEVRLHQLDTSYDPEYWHTAVTDSSGRASFQNLPPGRYELVVRREMTPEEAATSGQRVRAFADGQIVYVPSHETVELSLTGDHPGSLVFSEISVVIPLPWETNGSYFGGQFLELYNNTDTTIYLDKKIIGVAWNLNRDFTFWPCAQTTPFREDSQGLWSRYMMRFPGTGQQYPLAPGETALIARSAADHRSVHPSLPDLSHADFQFPDAGAANNPDVGTLLDIGLGGWPNVVPGIEDPLFIAEDVDITGLPRMRDLHLGEEYARIPAEKILDVAVTRWDWTKSAGFVAKPLCGAEVDRVFERLPGPAMDDYASVGRSASRRVLAVAPGGRRILEDTNTSMADFVVTPLTPGWIQ